MTRPAFFSGVTSSKCSNDNYFLTDVVPQKLIQHHMNLENLPNPQRFPSRNWAFLPAALVLGPHHTPPICDAQKGWRFHSPWKNSRTWMGTDSFHSPFWCLNPRLSGYPTPKRKCGFLHPRICGLPAFKNSTQLYQTWPVLGKCWGWLMNRLSHLQETIFHAL